MLFAILFDQDDQLVAAAPAVDVHHYGSRYWRDVYPRPLPPVLQGGTVQVREPELIEMLNSLAIADTYLPECRLAIERLVIAGSHRAGDDPASQAA